MVSESLQKTGDPQPVQVAKSCLAPQRPAGKPVCHQVLAVLIRTWAFISTAAYISPQLLFPFPQARMSSFVGAGGNSHELTTQTYTSTRPSWRESSTALFPSSGSRTLQSLSMLDGAMCPFLFLQMDHGTSMTTLIDQSQRGRHTDQDMSPTALPKTETLGH